MGYTTKFAGVLKFSRPMNGEQLRWLGGLLADYDHEWLGKLAEETGYQRPPFEGDDDFRHYVDLRITKDFSGLEWDTDTEKNSGMVTALQVIQHALLTKFPENPVHLEGMMTAKGEAADDVWAIHAVDGRIFRQNLKPPHETCCPNCRYWFKTETAKTRGE